MTAAFVERVKAAFPHKLIEITVSAADETAALLADGARAQCGGAGAEPVPVRTVAFHAEVFAQFTGWARTARNEGGLPLAACAIISPA